MNLDNTQIPTPNYGHSPQHILQGVLLDNFLIAFESDGNMELAGKKAAMDLSNLRNELNGFTFNEKQFHYLSDIVRRTVVGRASRHGKSESELLKEFATFLSVIEKLKVFKN